MEDIVNLSQRILKLFETNGNSEERRRNLCFVCRVQNIQDGLELSDEAMETLLKALLVDIGDQNATKYSSKGVCGKCQGSLGSLVDLFNQLEALRVEFNELRGRLGEKVIVGSLGESKEVYDGWLKDVHSVSDVFPSRAFKRLTKAKKKTDSAESSLEVIETSVKLEEDEMIAEETLEYCEYFVDHLGEHQKDSKHTQMTTSVDMRRLSGASLESPLRVPILDKMAESTEDNELKAEGTLDEPVDDCDTDPLIDPLEMDFDERVTERRKKATAEPSLRKLRPKKSFPVRQVEVTDGDDGDDDFCPIKSDSSEESEDVLEDEESVKKVKGVDKKDYSLRKDIPCGFCDLTFPAQSSRKKHLQQIHSLDSANPETPKCPYCLKMFLSRRNLNKHLEGIHHGVFKTEEVLDKNETSKEDPKGSQDVKRIHCSLCDKMELNIYSSVTELEGHAVTETHLENVHLKFNVHCNVCRVGFRCEVEALQVHLESQGHLDEMKTLQTVNRETYCFACRVDCQTPKDLAKHKSTRSHWKTCEGFMGSRVSKGSQKQSVECPLCPRKLANSQMLRNHLKRFHKQGGYDCEFCDKTFGNRRDYHSHRKIHTVPKLFSCSECSQTFETQINLSSHQRKHHSGVCLMCATCGKLFKTKAYLEGHERTQHPASGGKTGKYSCALCSKTFSIPRYVRRHVYKQHNEELIKDTPEVCLVCFHGFNSSEELTVHMSAHDDLKCYFCGKYFEIKTNLENHVRRHIGEKPFGCTFCAKEFGALHNLQEHMRRKKHMRRAISESWLMSLII